MNPSPARTVDPSRAKYPKNTTIAAAIAIASGCFTAPAFAQADIKTDGQWRYSLTAGLSKASGNTDSLSFSLNADAVVATTTRKTALYARSVYGKNDDVTTANQFVVGGRQDWELGNNFFAFGGGEWLRDPLANLSYRIGVNTGLGYHLYKRESSFWDVFGGIGYSQENYDVATEVADQTRARYGHFELLLGTESQQRLSATTTSRQRLVIFPNLNDRGEFRAVFEAGLSVAMTPTLALNASLSARHNSDPGTGLDKNDLLFITGITVKIQ